MYKVRQFPLSNVTRIAILALESEIWDTSGVHLHVILCLHVNCYQFARLHLIFWKPNVRNTLCAFRTETVNKKLEIIRKNGGLQLQAGTY